MNAAPQKATALLEAIRADVTYRRPQNLLVLVETNLEMLSDALALLAEKQASTDADKIKRADQIARQIFERTQDLGSLINAIALELGVS
jgi:hypothetical protein